MDGPSGSRRAGRPGRRRRRRSWRTGPVHARHEPRHLAAQPLVHLPVERLPQVRVLGQVRPEVLPVPARVGRLPGADAVRELDEGQLRAPARGVQRSRFASPLPASARRFAPNPVVRYRPAASSTNPSVTRWSSSSPSATGARSRSASSSIDAPSRSRSGSPSVTATRKVIGVASPAMRRISSTSLSYHPTASHSASRVNGISRRRRPARRPVSRYTVHSSIGDRAERSVEADGRLVPVQHPPLQPRVPARDALLRERGQQRLAQAADRAPPAARRGPPGRCRAAVPGREVEEPQRAADDRRRPLRPRGRTAPARAPNSAVVQLLGGQVALVRRALVLGQLVHQPDHGVHIGLADTAHLADRHPPLQAGGTFEPLDLWHARARRRAP